MYTIFPPTKEELKKEEIEDQILEQTCLLTTGHLWVKVTRVRNGIHSSPFETCFHCTATRNKPVDSGVC